MSTEFFDALPRKFKPSLTRQEWEAAFAVLDRDASGDLDAGELANVGACVVISALEFADLCGQLRDGRLWGAAAAKAWEEAANVASSSSPQSRPSGCMDAGPAQGDEVLALLGQRFENGGVVYFEPGERGRISAVYSRDGTARYATTWFRTGLTTNRPVHGWADTCVLVGKSRVPQGLQALQAQLPDRGRVAPFEYVD